MTHSYVLIYLVTLSEFLLPCLFLHPDLQWACASKWAKSVLPSFCAWKSHKIFRISASLRPDWWLELYHHASACTLVHCPRWTVTCRPEGVNSGGSSTPPHIPQHNVPFSFSPPAFSLPSSSSSSHYLIAVYTYGYFQQVREYKSMWTLSIHDQWRGPALYTKLSRRAGLFYSQPCGFKQIAQTGELKQLLYRSKKCRKNR